MTSPTSWAFYKEVVTKILAYKIRIVSKKEFELVKMQAEKKEQ